MRRGAKPAKAKVEAKLPVAGKSPKYEGTKVGDLGKRLAEALKREAEALEQQTATAEILRVISQSPTEVQPVFDTIVERACRLCDAVFATAVRFDGELIHPMAEYGFNPEARDVFRRHFPMRPDRTSLSGRTVLSGDVVHTEDATADTGLVASRELALLLGFRAQVTVPMLRDGATVGVITVARRAPGRFPERQVALLQTFADQAVIAIENVRLFTETKEALERQTATSEILRVISSAHTDAQPVFDTIVQSAVRLCRAANAAVFVTDGRMLHHPANYGASPEALATARALYPRPLDRGSTAGIAILTRAVVQVPDIEAPSASEHVRKIGRVVGFRSVVSVPMLRKGEAVGAINVTRQEPGRFSDAEVEMLKTFADQAVTAIENVRLFTELQDKNRALTEAHGQVTESLEQQTATSEILRVISSSPTDLGPVLDAVVRSATRFCGAEDATIFQVDGDSLRADAHYGPVRHVPGQRLPIVRGTVAGRTVLERRTIHVADLPAERDEFPEGSSLARESGHRTILSVPLLRESSAVGVIQLRRHEVQPFTDKQVSLLQTFADQAVIAIENVRLFKELEARTSALTRSVEQLTALGDVGRAVSSTLDLETVLSTIVSRAVGLSGLDGGVVFEYDEGPEEFILRVATETGDALAEARRTTRIRKGEGVLGRTAITLEPIQVPDITGPGAYEGRLRETLVESGIRAILAVPMIYEGRLIGCLGVTRNQPGDFPAETIELLRTFATQSALAIQNARLFEEIADKSRQLEAASQHKSEFLANMSHELRTPLNAILGFSEVLAQGMFGPVNEKQTEYLHDILESGRHLLSLINDILDLSKIEAGRMELELTDFDLPQAIQNALALVRERALRRGIALQHVIDPRLAGIRADERKVKQVLLNLLSNAIKFTPEGGRIEVRAAQADGLVEVSVTDTGIGIAPEDLEAVFEEFRQVGAADKKSEGTGLGLALAKKFVELHGGRIWVESEVGRGSTFTFTLPMS